jgi:hypothetical protein
MLQRFQVNLRGVDLLLFVRAMRALNEPAVTTAANVGPEDSVRVVEIGNDQIELGKIIHEVGREFTVAGKESSQPASLDGLHAIRQATRQCELCDVRVTENFEMRFWKLASQGCDGWKRENEISNRATSDDEDFAFAHSISPVVAADVRRRILGHHSPPRYLGGYIARNAVKPSTTTRSAKASRMALPIFTRFSFAVAQFSKSRNCHGHAVKHMPATMST